MTRFSHALKQAARGISRPNTTWGTSAIIALCWAIALVLNGAVPFVLLSTLGQAVVVMGYPLSFIDQGLLTLYPSHMGLPNPSPMTTLLAPALVMEPFLLLGLHPADAFAAALLIWISLGFFGAWRFCRDLGIGAGVSALAALLWFSFPIVWNSSNYSHLHFGFVLIPFLFYALHRLATALEDAPSVQRLLRPASIYVLAALLAVFTDGYTFMIFAMGASGLLGYRFLVSAPHRTSLVMYGAPIHAAAFGLSYVLYSAYIGQSGFAPADLDFFRGWGLDVEFALWPSRGVHWVWDVLGVSHPRSDATLFGDASVWVSTFLLPILAAAVYFGRRLSWRNGLAGGMALIAFSGFYLALGPSLKVGAERPAGVSRGMPAEYGVAPTGTAVLSANVPGFNSMRASYRWVALCYFGLWGVAVVGVARSRPETRKKDAVILAGTVLVFLPHLPSHITEATNTRAAFLQLDTDITRPLDAQLEDGEQVVMLPYGNDFLASYLAPRTDVNVYNVGGDKNFITAWQGWPSGLKHLPKDEVSAGDALPVLYTFATGETDAVVFPYFNLLVAAHQWPAPIERSADVAALEDWLASTGFVSVTRNDLFAVARLSEDGIAAREDGRLADLILGCEVAACRGKALPASFDEIAGFAARSNPYQTSKRRSARATTDLVPGAFPLSPQADAAVFAGILGRGWHGVEPSHVWSTASAKLFLPVPTACQTQSCVMEVVFTPFAASGNRRVELATQAKVSGKDTRDVIAFTDGAAQSVMLDVSGHTGDVAMDITVDNSASPVDLGIGGDSRQLGVALRQVRLIVEKAPPVAIRDLQPGSHTITAKSNRDQFAGVLGAGWHAVEPTHVWSTARADLTLDIPDVCANTACKLGVSLLPFAASPDRPVGIDATLTAQGEPQQSVHRFDDAAPHTLTIDASGQTGQAHISLSISGATSPETLGLSSDTRTLGVSLRSIDIVISKPE